MCLPQTALTRMLQMLRLSSLSHPPGGVEGGLVEEVAGAGGGEEGGEGEGED